MNDLTIAIVSWNCRQQLADCLCSIKKAEPELAYNVVVVDNDSEDGTVDLLRRGFPDVVVLANRENVGFARANNQVLVKAQSRYVLLLNPDTIVHGGALDTLVRSMDQHPSVWACGPAMLDGDGSLQHSGVRFPNGWNILCETFFLDRLFPESTVFARHKELYEDASKPRGVDYVQGACLMIRTEALQKAGGLDESFFMYFEETDWCYRAKQAGGEVYFFPDARVTHLGGSDIGHYDERRLRHYHTSLLRFYSKHYSVPSALVIRPIIAARSVIRIIVWTVVAAFRPDLRSKALSSIRGYVGTFSLLVRRTGMRS